MRHLWRKEREITRLAGHWGCVHDHKQAVAGKEFRTGLT